MVSEGVGFEPTVALLLRLISSHASANWDRIDEPVQRMQAQKKVIAHFRAA